MAQFIILTENTTQIAKGKKNGSGAILSHQGRFFSEVGTETGNKGCMTGLAKPQLSFQSIDTAIPGAKPAFV
jgi:hypothetical protein